MRELRDEFLSEEDLDLHSMSEDELFAQWDAWLEQAQSTNDLDEHSYSHGVFTETPRRSDPVEPNRPKDHGISALSR